MKIYYIEYTRDGHKTEAFTSMAKAKKRVSELKAELQELRKLWQNYIITRQNKPSEATFDAPDNVQTAEFEISSEGVIKAFLHRSKQYDNHRRN